MSIDWWQRKRLRGPRQRGAGGGRRREFHLLRQIFRKETCAGILASHFSYCITLIKGLPGRSSEPTVTAASCERSELVGKKTQKHPSEMSLSWQWYQLPCLKWSRPLHYLEINSYEFMWVPSPLLRFLPRPSRGKQIIELVQVHKASQRLM